MGRAYRAIPCWETVIRYQRSDIRKLVWANGRGLEHGSPHNKKTQEKANPGKGSPRKKQTQEKASGLKA
jgi:hypothetical protein